MAVICGNQFWAEQAKTIIMEVEREKVFLWEKLSEIQDLICLTGNLYGAVNEYEEVLDYALQRLNYDCNNNSCRLLTGEPLPQICANAILSKSRKTGQSKRK